MSSKRYLPLALLLLAICLVYSNSLSGSFHFDDFHAVTDNPAVRSLGNVGRIFRDTTAFSVLPANQTYRPVVTASLALDYALGRGYVPFPFHLSTLIWFLVLVTLLYFFFQMLLNRVEPAAANKWLALAIAGWFGLHPAMAETVDYVIQRGDLYCTLGCVAALVGFAHWPALRRYGFYLLPFVLAMFSKPPAAVFPLLLFLYVFFFELPAAAPVARWRRALTAALPSLVVTSLLLWLQSAMTPHSYLPSILSPASYRLTQPIVWARYATTLFLPLHLNVDTDLQASSHFDVGAFCGLLFVAGLVAAIVSAVRRPRLYPVAFGLLWFAITQLPTSLYPLSEVENDHRMFFSFPGFMLAVVWGLYLGYRRVFAYAVARGKQARLRHVAVTLAGLCLCGYAYGAHRRNAVWHTEDSLWADDVTKSPHNGRGLMIYGLTRMNAGDYAGALQLFTRALQYTPNYPTLEINLGVVNGLLAAQGKPALAAVAEQHFRRAVMLAPNDDTTHAYYGRWLLTQERLPEALGQLQAALALNPQRAMQRELLISAYQATGDTAAARQLAQQTLAMMPEDALARAALRDGPRTPVYQARIKPGTALSEDGYVNLSLQLSQAGRYEESLVAAQHAVELDPRSAVGWNNIAAAQAALHHWNEAIPAAQRAITLKPDFQLARNNLAWAERQKAAEQH